MVIPLKKNLTDLFYLAFLKEKSKYNCPSVNMYTWWTMFSHGINALSESGIEYQDTHI